MTLRYEGVIFSDGSCVVRRVAADPCDRATLTFESVRELEEEVGGADVSWLVAQPPRPTHCAQCRGPVYSLARPNAFGLEFCRKNSTPVEPAPRYEPEPNEPEPETD